MRVQVRRGRLGVVQCIAFFLVALFANAVACESTRPEKIIKEGLLDRVNGHPIADRLQADTLGIQHESVKLPGTNIAGKSKSGNVSRSESVEFHENFESGFLDPELWKIIQDGDVRQYSIEVTAVDPGKRDSYRLKLSMNTVGTRDETVKYAGIRSVNKLSFHASGEISFDFDWNNQSNGCYLTAAVYLCPTITNANPEKEANWIKFEYIGVPPGQNARAVFTIKNSGSVKHLFTEGWPENRRGRHIGLQRIKLILDTGGMTVLENGTLLYRVDSMHLKLEPFYFYLTMSSHSNYPLRELYFDNISILQQ